MCLAVYLSSETPLLIIPWRDAAPGLYVSHRVLDRRGVGRHLTKPYLYFIGTHTGCGCGFLYEGVVPGTPEHAETRSAYQNLSEYLQRYAAGCMVEIYTCWGGDEEAEPEHRRRVGVREIESDGFALEERELLTVDIQNALDSAASGSGFGLAVCSHLR